MGLLHKLLQLSKMHQELITSMLQEFVIQLKSWQWVDLNLFHNSNHNLLYSIKAKSHLLHPCWQLLHLKNRNKCWESACFHLFIACILILQGKLLACYWRLIIRSWYTCWNTMSRSRARLTKPSLFFKLINPSQMNRKQNVKIAAISYDPVKCESRFNGI